MVTYSTKGFLLILMIAMSFVAGGQAKLDLQFGTKGWVLFDNNSNEDVAACVESDSENNIYFGGLFYQGGNLSMPFITRTSQFGTVDLDFFNATNSFFKNYPGANVRSINFQSTGKFVVAFNGTNNPIRFARFFSNGSIDPTFGDNGVLEIIDFNYQAYSPYVIIDNEDRIIFCGVERRPNKQTAYIARLSKDGSMDEGFGFSGIVFLDLAQYQGDLRTLDIDKLGNIYSAGGLYDSSNATISLIVKLDNWGNFSNDFGINGIKAFVPAPNFVATLNSIKVSESGELVASSAAYEKTSEIEYFYAIKTTVKGELDNSFGNNGVFLFRPSSGAARSYTCELQRDNKIILSGTTSPGFPSFKTYATIVRVSEFGQIDSSFAPNGTLFLDCDNTELNVIIRSLIVDDALYVCGEVGPMNDQNKGDAVVFKIKDLKINSVADHELDFLASVFPNPTNGKINIKATNQIIKAEIYDLSGQLILDADIRDNQIDLSATASGIYILKLFTKNSSISVKLAVD